MKLNFLKNTLISRSGLARREMIIATVIIALLIAFSAVKFADLHAKCKEGSTKHGLTRLRHAVVAYYGDNRGTYPTDNLASLLPEYIEKIPYVTAGKGKASNAVHTAPGAEGGWYYFNDPKDPRWGDVIINLEGNDLNGKPWKEN